MFKLYQREGCPSSQQVRALLTNSNISYEVVNVAKVGSERHEILAMEGVNNAEVPLLVDGDRTIQGSGAIMEYIRSILPEGGFGDPSYGLTRTLKGVGFADAVPKIVEALKTEGFGVLTEIDVKATLKKKIDVDFKNYLILGACNPPLAHQALTAEPAIGLLLPCNVVVSDDHEGNAVVSAIDPMKMFSVVGRSDLEPVAKEVGQRLRRVLAAL
jgi:uncharacterized protein (DUF302 family)/glutaredoxin